jgi:hypothetical protein
MARKPSRRHREEIPQVMRHVTNANAAAIAK